MTVLQDIKPETIIPWALPLAFLMHLLDESFLNGGFVYGVQRLLWPQYNWTKFGLVNAGFFLLICLSSYLYHLRPGKWLILPLFWLWERSWNGIWHVLWTLIWQEYSPGLATSLLFPLMLIVFFRPTPIEGDIWYQGSVGRRCILADVRNVIDFFLVHLAMNTTR